MRYATSYTNIDLGFMGCGESITHTNNDLIETLARKIANQVDKLIDKEIDAQRAAKKHSLRDRLPRILNLVDYYREVDEQWVWFPKMKIKALNEIKAKDPTGGMINFNTLSLDCYKNNIGATRRYILNSLMENELENNLPLAAKIGSENTLNYGEKELLVEQIKLDLKAEESLEGIDLFEAAQSYAEDLRPELFGIDKNFTL